MANSHRPPFGMLIRALYGCHVGFRFDLCRFPRQGTDALTSALTSSIFTSTQGGGVFWVLRKPGIQRCFSIPPSPYWPDVPSVPWYKQTDPRQHNNSLSPVHGVELFSLDYEEGTLSYFYLSSLIPSRAGFVCLPHAARIWVYPLGPICRPHIWPTTARYQSLPFKAACSL
jgi:hypothetical protein